MIPRLHIGSPKVHARTKQYKYYLSGKFYDIVADPKEQKSLADAKLTDEQRRIRDELRAVVERYKRPNAQPSKPKRSGKKKVSAS